MLLSMALSARNPSWQDQRDRARWPHGCARRLRRHW